MKGDFIRMDIIPQDTPQKQCTRCKKWMDRTPAFFFRMTKSHDGLQSQCKKCIGTPREPVPDGYKRCKKCGNVWLATLDFYYADKRELDGLRFPCKQCVKDYTNTNREEVRASSARVYQKDKDRIKRKSHDWYFAHKEHCSQYHKAYGARYRLKHPKPKMTRVAMTREERLEYRRVHYYPQERLNATRRTQNPIPRKVRPLPMTTEERREAARESYRKSYRENPAYHIARVNKRKALKRSLPGTHTAQQLREQFQRQKGKCYYCKCKIEKGKNTYHADHVIPLSRGGSNDISNIVITCRTCNLKKHDKMPHEWPEGNRLM